MLYTLFLYQNSSGLLMYDKSFQDVSSGKMELFSSFFSAIKTFISEIVLEGSKELKNIEMGDYTIIVSSIKDISVDIIMIADRQDYKIINKLIPKIIKILLKHKQLLLEWNRNKQELRILDKPLSDLIASKKKLMGDGSAIRPIIDQPIKANISQKTHIKKDLSEIEYSNLIQERTFLISRLEKDTTTNLLRKLAISKKVMEISEQLNDGDIVTNFQEQIKQLTSQIDDTKFKLDFFLNKAKKSLAEAVEGLGARTLQGGDYKDAYLNLYSFSTKLKSVSDGIYYEEMRELAKKLISISESGITDHELSEVITKILNLSSNIDDYLE